MKKLRVRLAVDQLEARTTPAGTFLRPPIESGAFVPPGFIAAANE